MGEEPLQDITPLEFQRRVEPFTTTQDLADAFAATSNKFWWVEDDEYDFEKGTEEYKRAVALTDEWGALMDKYEGRIFEILRTEGVEIPPTGRIVALVPFMKRYGYDDMGGWWINQND